MISIGGIPGHHFSKESYREKLGAYNHGEQPKIEHERDLEGRSDTVDDSDLLPCREHEKKLNG